MEQWNVGILIGNLQTLEYGARSAVATMTESHSGIDLRTVQPGDMVPEDPLTSYDQLAYVLKRFNKWASPGHQLDVRRIVNLRDQLAHGRAVAFEPKFPLTLLKFGKPAKGEVPVLARVEMTEAWFIEQRTLVHNAIQTVAAEVSARPPSTIRRVSRRKKGTTQ